MDREVNCVNTKVLIEYIKNDNKFSLSGLFQNLHPDIDTLDDPEKFFSDENNWTSSTVTKALFQRACELYNDDEIMYKVGFSSVINNRLGYIQSIFLRFIGNPKSGIKKAQEINDKFNKTKQIEIKHLSRRKAVLHLKWHKNMDLSKDFCLLNKGIYSAIPQVFNLPPAKLIEKQCFFNGHNYCEYTLEWKEHSILINLFNRIFMRNKFLKETVNQIKLDKALIEKKYNEIYNLNISLQKKIQQLKAIQNSTQIIASIIDQNNLLNMTMNILTHLFHFDRAIIFSVDYENDVLKYTFAVGEDKEIISKLYNYKIPLSRVSNVMVRVAHTGIPIIIDDTDRNLLNQNNYLIRMFNPVSFIIVPLITHNKVIGILAADRKKTENPITENDKDYLLTYANLIANALENSRLYNDLKESYIRGIKALIQTIETKDPYLKGHSDRIAYYAGKIAEKMNLRPEVFQNVIHVALLHDIGEIGISDRILQKPERLTKEEFNLIRAHPKVGEKILKHISILDKNLARSVRHHHERFDGQGYPDGLYGKNIPLESRIISVLEGFDAMTTLRSYRPVFTLEETIQELKENAGTQFDPEIVDILLKVLIEEKKFELKEVQ